MPLNLPAAFAAIANHVSAALGAPYWDGEIIVDGAPGGIDDNGEWQPGSPPTRYPCRVQIDGADEYMKSVEGFADKEAVFIILRAGLAVEPNSDERVEVTDPAAPPFFRRVWMVASLSLDPAGIGYAGKGRPA